MLQQLHQMQKNFDRVSKLISHYGFCSRRDAEKFIKMGKVKINGEIYTNFILPDDEIKKIEVDGKELFKPELRIWVLNKSEGIICSSKRQNNKKIIFDILPKNMPRVISVGRLDLNSEGLLILTNSPIFAEYLENPKNQISRRYEVKISGNISDKNLSAAKEGILIENINYGSMNITKKTNKENNNWLEIEIFEGKNREIRKILSHFGHMIKKLRRIQYGPFFLKNLTKNKTIELDSEKINKKLVSLGLNVEDYSR